MARGRPGAAGAAALHTKYPAGHQTAAQLRAERANLAKGRAKRGDQRNTHSDLYHNFSGSTPQRRENAMAKRTRDFAEIGYFKVRPLEVRYLRYKAMARLPKPRIYGTPAKFKKEISPGGYQRRTSWRSSGNHGFTKHVRKRKARTTRVKKWRHGRKTWTPR